VLVLVRVWVLVLVRVWVMVLVHQPLPRCLE
jgi:hypothetical protein